MDPAPTPAQRAGSVLVRVGHAVLSLLVLTVTVGVLPLLLTWATPVIWASSHDDLAHLLDRQDTGSVFLLVLIAVGWIGWAQFTFCTARELVAQLQGRRWHAPRGLGVSQRAAALLVGSILVLLPTGSALASDAQAATTTAAAARTPSTASPSPPETSPAGQDVQAATSGARGSYTVRETRPAESLWSIAERELGDGERWREIAALNEGHTMPGGHVFRSSSFLQPGWTLAMPEQPGHQSVRTQTERRAAVSAETGEHLVTVRVGDSLSAIAQDELGNGNAWPRLFKASHGKPQPNALPVITDPDVIYPGQQVTVPATRPRPGGPSPDRPSSGNTGSKQPPEADQDNGATPPATPDHSTPAPAPSSPGTPPSISATPEQPTPSPASPETAEPAPASGLLSLPTVLGAGALLAAAVTAALALRRTLQRRRTDGPGYVLRAGREAVDAW
ncbi:LysM peptidoglycan-binding domain-containing protein, partial [Streptomyces sp. NPDC005070]